MLGRYLVHYLVGLHGLWHHCRYCSISANEGPATGRFAAFHSDQVLMMDLKDSVCSREGSMCCLHNWRWIIESHDFWRHGPGKSLDREGTVEDVKLMIPVGFCLGSFGRRVEHSNYCPFCAEIWTILLICYCVLMVSTLILPKTNHSL